MGRRHGLFQDSGRQGDPGPAPGFDRSPPQANPIGGPVYVEGAERGDTLVVAIEEVLVGDYSWIAIGPKRGPLGESTRWPELSSDYTTRIFLHEPGPSGGMGDGTLHFSDRISWPITPFVGTLGTAPDREVCTSLDGQGEWGGNLDVRDVRPGNRIHLPVFHAGGLFYLGDVHASQGDTEFTGTAAETTAVVRLRLDLVKGGRPPWMRIDKPDAIVAVYASRPLEAAVEGATIHLMDWLISDYGFTPTEAYCFVSTCPDFRIHVYQMCKIGKMSFVAGAEVAEAVCAYINFPGTPPLGSTRLLQLRREVQRVGDPIHAKRPPARPPDGAAALLHRRGETPAKTLPLSARVRTPGVCSRPSPPGSRIPAQQYLVQPRVCRLLHDRPSAAI